METNAVKTQFTCPADPEWIAAAKEFGISPFDGGWISRSQCILLRDQKNIPLPRWLMKDLSRRSSGMRGQYFCPEWNYENEKKA